MDKTKLPDNSRREKEWINIAQPHRSADIVDGKYEWQPGADDRFEVLGRIRVKIRLCTEATDPVDSRRDLHAEIRRHFECVHDVKVVRPRLSEPLPGMGCRIGCNVAVLPVGGRTFGVVLLQSFGVICRIVAEDRPACIQSPSIAHKQIPEMMPHFMPEMPKQRSVGFSHLQSATLAFDIVSFRKGNSDHPIFVPRHDLLAARGIVSQKMKAQSMI